MPLTLPTLTDAQKFTVRDLQLRIANINEAVRNLTANAQAANKELQTLLEGLVIGAGLKFEQVTFELDSLTFKEVIAPPAATPIKRVPKPKAVTPPTA